MNRATRAGELPEGSAADSMEMTCGDTLDFIELQCKAIAGLAPCTKDKIGKRPEDYLDNVKTHVQQAAQRVIKQALVGGAYYEKTDTGVASGRIDLLIYYSAEDVMGPAMPTAYKSTAWFTLVDWRQLQLQDLDEVVGSISGSPLAMFSNTLWKQQPLSSSEHLRIYHWTPKSKGAMIASNKIQGCTSSLGEDDYCNHYCLGGCLYSTPATKLPAGQADVGLPFVAIALTNTSVHGSKRFEDLRELMGQLRDDPKESNPVSINLGRPVPSDGTVIPTWLKS